jgi:tetratricopeptide (TPR) repeat protein
MSKLQFLLNTAPASSPPGTHHLIAFPMNSQMSPGALATTHFQNSEYPLAVKEYQKLLADDPSSGYLHAMLALCHLQQNNLEDSESIVQKGILRDPSYAGLYYIASGIRQRKKENGGAESYLLKALSLRPGDADYLGLLATLQNQRQEYQLAFQTATRGLDSQQNHAVCAKQVAIALGGLSKKSRAPGKSSGLLLFRDNFLIGLYELLGRLVSVTGRVFRRPGEPV